jgi:hypothetical protein
VVFILFYLDLQISLNGFENKQIKEKKKKGIPVLLAAWRPARPACLPVSPLLGRRGRASSSPCPRGLAQANTA